MRSGLCRSSGAIDVASIVEYHARIVCAARKARLASDDGRARNTKACRPLYSTRTSSESDSEVGVRNRPSTVRPPVHMPLAKDCVGVLLRLPKWCGSRRRSQRPSSLYQTLLVHLWKERSCLHNDRYLRLLLVYPFVRLLH